MSVEDLNSLSRRFNLSDLDDEPKRVEIEVAEEDRGALAERFDVSDIARLCGEMDVQRFGGLIRVAGSIEADLGRTCVVSLEPMRELINENFAVEYTTEFEISEDEETEIDLDAPEPLRGEEIDLGDVLLEQLVLLMNAHPRKDDAKPPADPGAGRESSPFDVLKGLKE